MILLVDSTVLNVVARQKWNDQWWTYVRYLDVDVSGGEGYAVTADGLAAFWCDYRQYTVSVRYNYTPNLWFELGYDYLDLGSEWIEDSLNGSGGYGDNMIWFRTTVNF